MVKIDRNWAVKTSQREQISFLSDEVVRLTPGGRKMLFLPQTCSEGKQEKAHKILTKDFFFFYLT